MPARIEEGPGLSRPRKVSLALAALLGLMLALVISAFGLAGCGRKSGLDLPPIAAPAQQPAPAPAPEPAPANPPQR
jgi:predicted small lipoprotein YifL